jgi:hypothetical protein
MADQRSRRRKRDDNYNPELLSLSFKRSSSKQARRFLNKLQPSDCVDQLQSPLFGVIPPELRSRIYDFVFECTIHLADTDPDVVDVWEIQDARFRASFSIHTTLLQTCRTIYLESRFQPVHRAAHHLVFRPLSILTRNGIFKESALLSPLTFKQRVPNIHGVAVDLGFTPTVSPTALAQTRSSNTRKCRVLFSIRSRSFIYLTGRFENVWRIRCFDFHNSGVVESSLPLHGPQTRRPTNIQGRDGTGSCKN